MQYALVFYLFLPAFVANAVPVVIRHVPLLAQWNTPLHSRWFGSHKTYRGICCGILGGMLTAYLQFSLPVLAAFSPFADSFSALQAGFLLGGGALFGDLLESFIKRRLALPPGQALVFWDGADYIIGAIACFSPLYFPSIPEIIFLLVVGPILSLLANCISYLLGWKDVWY